MTDKLNSYLHSFLVFFKFSQGSLLSAALDFILFIITFKLSHSLLAAVIIGRVISSAFNYYYNYRVAFQAKNNVTQTFLKYFLLAIFIMFGSYLGILILIRFLHLNIYIAKAITETLLFFVNYFVQKYLVFINKV